LEVPGLGLGIRKATDEHSQKEVFVLVKGVKKSKQNDAEMYK